MGTMKGIIFNFFFPFSDDIRNILLFSSLLLILIEIVNNIEWHSEMIYCRSVMILSAF